MTLFLSLLWIILLLLAGSIIALATSVENLTGALGSSLVEEVGKDSHLEAVAGRDSLGMDTESFGVEGSSVAAAGSVVVEGGWRRMSTANWWIEGRT